jgi:hypothetical protein
LATFPFSSDNPKSVLILPSKPLPKLSFLRPEGKIPPDNSSAMTSPEPLIVAEKLSVFVPTLQLIETVPPLTVPVTSSGSPGTGP